MNKKLFRGRSYLKLVQSSVLPPLPVFPLPHFITLYIFQFIHLPPSASLSYIAWRWAFQYTCTSNTYKQEWFPLGLHKAALSLKWSQETGSLRVFGVSQLPFTLLISFNVFLLRVSARVDSFVWLVWSFMVQLQPGSHPLLVPTVVFIFQLQ